MRLRSSHPVKDILIDLLLLVAFLVLYEEHATGGPVHEWLGIVIAVFMIIHIIFHWRWITCLIKNFFGKLSSINRIKFLLNILIFISFSTIIFSGIMMSRHVMSAFGINSFGVSYWKWLHFTAVDISLWLIAIHIALNWHRIVKMFQSLSFKSPAVSISNQPETIPVIRNKQSYGFSYRSLTVKYFMNILLILLLACSISLFWYGYSLAETAYSGVHYPRHEKYNYDRQNYIKPGRYSYYQREQPGHHNGRGNHGRHQKFSFIGIWPGITKNVFIISMITFGVVFTGHGFRKAKSLHTDSIKGKLRG